MSCMQTSKVVEDKKKHEADTQIKHSTKNRIKHFQANVQNG